MSWWLPQRNPSSLDDDEAVRIGARDATPVVSYCPALWLEHSHPSREVQ